VALAVLEKKSRNCLGKKKDSARGDRQAIMGPLDFLIRICQHNFGIEMALVEHRTLVGRIVSIVAVFIEKLGRKIHVHDAVQLGPRGAFAPAFGALGQVLWPGVFGQLADLYGQGGVCSKSELEAPLGPEIKVWASQKDPDVFMGHVEKTQGLFDAVTTHISVLSGLLGPVRQVKCPQVLEEHVTTHREALVKNGPWRYDRLRERHLLYLEIKIVLQT